MSNLAFYRLERTRAASPAVAMVTRRNPVYSAVWLLVSFLCVAVLFLNLSAPFLAAIHVLVYTGAILVLFLFVIMLLNLKDPRSSATSTRSRPGGVAGMCSVLFLGLAIPSVQDPSLKVASPVPARRPSSGRSSRSARCCSRPTGCSSSSSRC